MSFTNRKFFILTLASHAGLFFILLNGSWLQILTCFLLFCFITLFSSTILYHRFLSHRSWNAPRWYEIFATILGIFSFTGTPITRTLAHRYHHAYADTEKDPHSPKQLPVYLVYFPMLTEKKLNPMIVRDLLSDKFHMYIHRNYLTIITITIFLSFFILGPLWTITLFIAPGALCWSNISLCNILCHWSDQIKQSKILAWLTFGEGFHNYHHEKPNDPNFGNENFDVGFYAIKLVEKINGYLQRT